VKKREKFLQEELAKLKAASSQEKEAMMSKILGFQQHLQRSDTAGGNVEALEMKVKRLLKEKTALEVDLEASNSRCGDLQTRVTQLDTLSEEFIQVHVLTQAPREQLLSGANDCLDCLAAGEADDGERASGC
jgi:DNA repair exonuclease SbcCD ATPase subunit